MNSLFEEMYEGYQLTYRPFEHEDGTFSLSAEIRKAGHFIHGTSSTNSEVSFSTSLEAAQAGRKVALHWLKEHIDLWAKE